MKPTIFFRLIASSILLFLVSGGIAQSIVSGGISTNVYVEAYNIRGKPFNNSEATNIEGSPLLNPSWGLGTVYFKDGSVAQNVELRFNLEKNELYFNREGEMYVFNDPVSSFRMNYSISAAKKEVYFRSGYPVNGRLSKETFYEVEEDGAKFQLINYRFIYLADSYQYGGTAKKVFTEKEELYVFDVAFGKTSKIKRTEADVLNALPDLKEKIASIVSKNKLKLKVNEDMKKLFTELNK